MKVKFGNAKYAFEGDLDDFFNKYTALVSQISKYNAELLGKMYESTPEIINYFAELGKTFKFFNERNKFSDFLHERNKSSDSFREPNKFFDFLRELNKSFDFLREMNKSPDFLRDRNKSTDFYRELNKIFKYLYEINRAFKEYMQPIGQKTSKRPEGPGILPASGHDIYNYVAKYGLANCQVQAILTFDGHLDFNKLSQAVRSSVDTQPVFGSRFVENEPPYWKRLDNIDKAEFCSMETVENPEEAIRNFLEGPLDMDRGPMLKVKLLRSGQNDTLCIKSSHACCDGAGIKEYLQLLSEIYSVTDRGCGIFISIPQTRNRKDQDALFKTLGITDPEAEWIPGSEITNATWPFPWEQAQSDKFHLLFSRLPKGYLSKMKQYAKTMNATVNDLILTAYYRAMSQTAAPIYGEPMEIAVTTDLRRYLPDHRTEAIRNFSGSECARLMLLPDETFEDTLSRVVSVMNEIKNSRPGLQSAIGLERIERMTFAETREYYKLVSQWPLICGGKCAPVLSNLGMLSDSLLKFGSRTVVDAFITPTVMRAPGLMLVVGTYDDVMTFSMGYYEGSAREDVIRSILNKVRDEIIEGCGG